MKRLLFLSLFFSFGISLSLVQDYYEQEAKDKLIVNPIFRELEEKAMVGDLIIIDSDNFMSSLFKKLDDCDYSSFKVVVTHARKKMILVADIDNLADKEGFYISEMEGFFSDYDQVRISLWRPKNKNSGLYSNLASLKFRALQNNMPYDFAYNYRSKKSMSCIKMIQKAYGLEIFDDVNFKKFPYYNPLMCDLKLEQFFAKQIDTFPFWINSIKPAFE